MENLKRFLAYKVETLAIIFYIAGIFLLDVNANIISSSGNQALVAFFGDISLKSASMFWLGLIVATVSLFLFSIRSVYLRKKRKGWDIFFVVLGVLGWGVIFSGALLILAGCGNFMMPFFNYVIPRISFYHFGIVLSAITLLYFALTRG